MPIYKMKGKKDGQQKYRVRVNYIDANGNARQLDRVEYGLAEAKALEAKLTKEMKDAPKSSGRTIRQLFDEYIEVKRHDVRETSLDKTRQNLERYVLPYVEDIRLDKLTTTEIQKWKSAVNGLGLGISTRQNNAFGEFRALLNYAIRMEYIQKNPLLTVGNFKDAYDFSEKEKEEQLHYYTAEQFSKFITVARNASSTLTDWGYYTFFNIAFYTGMRKGEINALKWTDIEGDILHVRRSIAQKLKGQDRETPPKNKSSYRCLKMPVPLVSILNEQKKRQQSMKTFTEDWRICGGFKCLRDTSISNKNIRYAQEAGLNPIRIHDFRHTHATLLINEGINIQEIARRLGHSDVKETWGTYAHLYPREEDRAVEILNKIV